MNKSDSERLGSALERMGLHEAAHPKDADVVILNSCVVRQSAEDKVTGMLGTIKPLKDQRPDRVLALMGCMVGPRHEDLKTRFPHIDVFMRPQQYEPLLNLLGDRFGTDWEGCLTNLVPLKPTTTSYIPIIHGCDLMCTFCIIPYRRGRQISRPIADIVSEIEQLVVKGVKEVTLLGQTVDAYGYDLPNQPDLAELLIAANAVSGLDRIRFLTSHPIFMTQRIIQAVRDLDKVCEHINLPIQAGHNETLARMRRHYTTEEYKELITTIRATIPNVCLSTDVIVGFCDETPAQFQGTVDILEELRFDKVHLASYSPRPGTIAWRKIEDSVPREEKRRRLSVLEELQKKIATEVNSKYLGQCVEILVEGQQKGKWVGRTRGDKLVYFQSTYPDWTGKLAQVTILSTSPWSLMGSIIDPTPHMLKV